MPQSTEINVRREKTAIRRFRLSRPIAQAIREGLIHTGVTVLDYGCGRGEDVCYLREDGIEAIGWDPYFQPDVTLLPADVVNLGYVLNVIEDVRERRQTLLKAFELAQGLLIVAVRVDRGPKSGDTYRDGVITTRGGFQKVYTQGELRSYLEAACGHLPTMAALGIAYVFKDLDWQREYLAQASVYQPSLGRRAAIAEFESSDIGKEYLELSKAKARIPLPQEFPRFAALRKQFGSPQRIASLTKAVLDPGELARLRGERRESFLVYYAAIRLQGLLCPTISRLPVETQADIRAMWGSLKAARAEGERFLFSLGDATQVRTITKNVSVGKLVGESLYAHQSVEAQLPPLNRLQIFAARQIVGDADYDVVKLSVDGRKVSFLRYPDFDTLAHPTLSYSLVVYLPKADYSYRDYSDSENPPVLHRKESLVDDTYPAFQKFVSLTRQEDKHSLLSRPDIGHKKEWERVLAEAGFKIRGHRLVRRK